MKRVFKVIKRCVLDEEFLMVAMLMAFTLLMMISVLEVIHICMTSGWVR